MTEAPSYQSYQRGDREPPHDVDAGVGPEGSRGGRCGDGDDGFFELPPSRRRRRSLFDHDDDMGGSADLLEPLRRRSFGDQDSSENSEIPTGFLGGERRRRSSTTTIFVGAALALLAAFAAGIAAACFALRPTSPSSALSHPALPMGAPPQMNDAQSREDDLPSTIDDSRRGGMEGKEEEEDVSVLGMSRAKMVAQDEVRRYRDAFLNREKLLDTEEATFGDDDQSGRKTKDEQRAPLGCDATVVLLRHCEKGDVREHCNYMGYERSVYLSTLFGDDAESRWPAPAYVYAMSPGERNDRRTKNMREIETVKPLADKFDLTVDDRYGLNEVSKFSKRVFQRLRSGEMCGKVAVVAWKHTDIARLAQRLGCGPFEGCPMDYPSMTFDEAWLIKYVYMVPWHSDQKEEKLLRGPRRKKRHHHHHHHHHNHTQQQGGTGEGEEEEERAVGRDFRPPRPKWNVFGNIQREGFDPLNFGKVWGDYSSGGGEGGGTTQDAGGGEQEWLPDDVKEVRDAIVDAAELAREEGLE